MKPLVGTHSGQIPDGGGGCSGGAGRNVVHILEINTVVNDMNAIAIDIETALHLPGVILADRNEGVDVFHPLPKNIPGFRPLRLRQGIEKGILPMKGRDDGNPKLMLDRPGEASEQDVAQTDDIGAVVVLHPLEQTSELRQFAVFPAPQGGQGEIGVFFRIGHVPLL